MVAVIAIDARPKTRHSAHHWSTVLILTIAMVASGCRSSTVANDPDDPQQPSTFTELVDTYSPRFEPKECPFEIPTLPGGTGVHQVDCGVVIVPQDRSLPKKHQVELEVARIRSTSVAPTGTPVVFLHGGPGGSALRGGINQRASLPLLDNHDLILFDQRGAGLSTPLLNCPEREQAIINALSGPTEPRELRDSMRASMSECIQRLERESINLQNFSTSQSAVDVFDIARAFELDSISLWGVSYGTRVAMETMRIFPSLVQSAVLDSVSSIDSALRHDEVKYAGDAFSKLNAACKTQPSCVDAFGDLQTVLEDAISVLDRQPRTVSITHQGKTFDVSVNGQLLAAGVFFALYDSSFIPTIPLALDAIAAGIFDIIDFVAQNAVEFLIAPADAAFVAVSCNDESVREPIEDANAKENELPQGGTASDSELFLELTSAEVMCDLSNFGGVDPAFGDRFASDVPTLIIAGELDPVTPASVSRSYATSLGGTYVEIERAGHVPGSSFSCVRVVISAFFDDPTQANTQCVAGMQPAEFQI